MYIVVVLVSTAPLAWIELFAETKRTSNWSLRKRKYQNLTLFTAWFTLFCFAAFRAISVGADYSRYRSHYYSDQFFSSYEPLFRIFSGMLYPLVPDFNLYSDVLIALALLLVFYAFYRMQDNKWLGVCLFQALYAYGLMFSALRQSVAIGLCTLALSILYSSKSNALYRIIPVLMIIIASLFHYSAIFCLGLVLIWYVRNHPIFYIPFIAISLLLMFFGNNILNFLLNLIDGKSHYADYTLKWGPYTIVFIITLFLVFFLPRFLEFSRKDTAKNNKSFMNGLTSLIPRFFRALGVFEKVLFHVLLVTLIFNICFVWIPSHYRITIYFYMGIILVLMKTFDTNRKTDWAIVILSLANYVFLLLRDVIGIVPYTFSITVF